MDSPSVPPSSWKAGQTVLVIPLGRRGIIQNQLRNGSYRVQIGNLEVKCQASDLEPVLAAPSKKKKLQTGQTSRAISAVSSVKKGKLPKELDLHGLRVTEAMALVDDTIDHAILQDAERLAIVHGIGSGRIKEALHRHLKTLTAVKSFKVDPLNSGVTIVYF
jgi:DNA mismatch repair protein MutS2